MAYRTVFITTSLVFLAAILCVAQDIDIKITKGGKRDFFIDIKTKEASVLDILSVLSEKTGFKLDAHSPVETQILENKKIGIELVQADLIELTELLGMSCGLHFEVDSDKLKIHLGSLPGPKAKGAAEFFRQRSLEAVFTAYGGDPRPEYETELLLRSARLHEAGGNMNQAYNTYKRFVEKYSSDDRAPKITLLAAETAIKAGLDTNAFAHIADFLKDFSNSQDVGKALILGAKARLMKDDLPSALALFKRAIRQALDKKIPERDGLIAEYYVAELHHANGDDPAAIKLLEQVQWRHNAKHNRELLDQVWLYLGICRRASGNRRDALHDLSLAIYTGTSPKFRIRVLLLSAQTYLEIDNPFFALNAARCAIALGAEGPQLFQAMTLQGQAYRDLFLYEKARKELLKAIMDSPTLLPEDKERQKKTTATMRQIADALFEDFRFQEARETFETIAVATSQRNLRNGNKKSFNSEFMAELKYMIARCHERLGDYKKSLEILDGITAGVGSEPFLKEIRRLRGDCFMQLKMYEQAIQTWTSGDSR